MDRIYQRFIHAASGFKQASMQVNNPGRARAFMKVINVLGYYSDIEIRFQFREYFMTPIGFHLQSFLPALIVKFKNKSRILFPPFKGGYLHNIISFPQTIGISKGRYSAFSAD